MAELLHKEDYKEFDYTGSIQSIELRAGEYTLEVWGAQGGPSSWNTSLFPGGYGGYAKGTYIITQKTTIYIGIGGRGYNNSGGYNGGGSGGHSNGGGATHIATANGTLASLASNKSSVIIVAGGGGGCEYQSAGSGGGHGGGANQSGTAGVGDYSGYGNGAGGTISGGYSFGQGGPGNGYHSGSGGGGYYGGYAGDSDNHAGGGGSGFADTTKLTNISGSTGIHEGHGHAKITLLNKFNICYEHDNGIEDIIINPEKYEVGDTITLTPILKQGYLWDKWTGDIESINEVLTITIEDANSLISVYANSKPGPTKYTIKHYTQNLDITTYTLQDTEILDGITNDIVYPDIKTYKGFTSPDIQSITLKNDGTTILNYYYTRNKYKASVISDGHTNKSEYYFEENGEIIYDNTLDNIYAFTGWRTNHKITIINNGLKTCKFYMPANDIEFYVTYILNRLNSNIYKNIFPEEVINMDFINKSLANTIISTEDIRQDNHGLSVKDFVYLDDDGLYKKALAEESTRANVVGIVSKVAGPNVFTLMDSGTIPFDHLDYNDTTILYLSDKIPGKAVHYSEISNTIYIPVAVYIEDKIIIHLQQGSIGDILAPYEEEEQSFETYTEQELNDVINQITNGVK